MILGLVGEEPTGVEAVASNYLHNRVADVTTTHLAFPSGVRGHVFVSWLHPFKEQKLVVVGDRAMATFDDSEPWESKLAVYDQSVDWLGQHPVATRVPPVYQKLVESEPLRTELSHFLDCVVSGAQPTTDGSEATAVLRVLQEASLSIAGGTAASDGMSSQDAQPEFFVHPTSEIDADVSIGEGTKIWHFSHVLSGSRIGQNCSFGQSTMVGPNVSVGDNCRIQNNVSLFEGVELKDDVFCGPSAVFTNVVAPRAFLAQQDRYAPTVVGHGASVGANATVVCGNSIGAYALIGAGAVVTNDVKAHALVVGVPARQVGWVSHRGFVLGDDLLCGESGDRYEVAGGELCRVEEGRQL